MNTKELTLQAIKDRMPFSVYDNLIETLEDPEMPLSVLNTIKIIANEYFEHQSDSFTTYSDKE